MSETGELTPQQKLITRAFILIVVIFFVTLLGFGYVIRSTIHLGQENRHRINDIQASRIESCQTTYLGIRKVFEPFFPQGHLTDQQKKDLAKFNATIDLLRKQCAEQTRTGGN